ncbi:MAG: hypothetical protein VKJ46_01640 [Leptolyngbyaceae bacterium]|nr:hypothetical protein [Leptolyngbyaceae bacterium]
MKLMMRLSLIINIVVLAPVCLGIISQANWVQAGYGAFSPAQGILLSIYLAIFSASIALLFIMDKKFIFSLLFIQVFYKITTPFTVGTLMNPVVISNLFIAAFHFITLLLIYKSRKKKENF